MAGDYDGWKVNPVFTGDDDDECVIFKGSPLYDSLMQSGYEISGDEVEGSVRSELLRCQDSTKPQKWNKDNEVETTQQTAFTRLKSQLIYFYKLVVKTFSTHLDRDCLVKQNNLLILEKLKKCSALDEDDADFMEWFIDIPVSDDRRNKTGSFKWSLAVITPVFLSYAYTRVFHTIPFGEVIRCTDWIAILCTAFLSMQTACQLVNTLRRKEYRQEGVLVDELLGGSEKYQTVLRKSLRLIQETELIARGFTLVSQRNPLSRLEEGKRQTARHCPALRKLLFTCSCDSIHLLRDKTRLLLKQLPYNPEIDVKSGYLAFEPIENYGPCLQMTSQDGLNDGNIYSLTDGYSVSALKGISHLLMLHLSEFIKGLAIFYHQDYKHTELNHDQVLNIVRELLHEISSRTDSLQRSMEFHNSSLIRKDKEPSRVRGKSEFEDLYIAVHSLDLHLQSALTRVRSLSTQIESHDPTKTQSDLSYGQIDEQIQPIRAELTSCNNCFSEALNRLETVMGKSKIEEGELQNNTVPLDKDREKTKDVLKEIEDYIIVDQVFEAYTDPDEIGMLDDDWAKALTPEEKERKRKEKEEALRMMSELKSVIKVRAKDTEKRETAALIRSTQGKGRVQSDVETEQNTECDNSISGEIKHLTAGISSNSVENETSNVDAIKKENEISLEDELKLSKDNVGILECEDVLGTSVKDLDAFKTKSVVTQLGVRRLRKGNMLDDSDSDEEVVTTTDLGTESFRCYQPNKYNNDDKSLRDIINLPSGGDDNVDNGVTSKRNGTNDNNMTQQIDRNIGEDQFFCNTSESDTNDDADGFARTSFVGASLEERLARYSGLDFGVTSDIASMAAARSKFFGNQDETTFGAEEEYGELSEDESNT